MRHGRAVAGEDSWRNYASVSVKSTGAPLPGEVCFDFGGNDLRLVVLQHMVASGMTSKRMS